MTHSTTEGGVFFDTPLMKYALSEKGDKLGIIVVSTIKKGEYGKTVTAMVVGQEREVLSEVKFKIPQEYSNYMEDIDLVVNNDGDICILIKKLEGNMLNSENVLYYILVHDGKVNNPVRVELGETEEVNTARILANDDYYVIAGNYKKKDKNNNNKFHGVFTCQIDKSGEKGEVVIEALPFFLRIIDMGEAGKSLAKTYEKDDIITNDAELESYVLIDLRLNPDGTAFWLLERQSAYKQKIGTLETIYYVYGTIITLQTSKEGKIDWVNEFERDVTITEILKLNGKDDSGVVTFPFDGGFGMLCFKDRVKKGSVLSKNSYEWHTQTYDVLKAGYEKRLNSPSHNAEKAISDPPFTKGNKLEKYKYYSWNLGKPISATQFAVPAVYYNEKDLRYLIINFEE